jgi:hypothetical protein
MTASGEGDQTTSYLYGGVGQQETVERQGDRLVQETALTNEDIDAYFEVCGDLRYNWASEE